MADKPSIAIFVHTGDPEPTIFSTAASRKERRALAAWLSEHPELEDLVERAWELAENGDEEDFR